MVLVRKEPNKTPIRAGRLNINTVYSAIPADGYKGEMLPGGIKIRWLNIATIIYASATAGAMTQGDLNI